MRLETELAPPIDDASEADIRTAFADPAVMGSFAILSEAPERYLQTAPDGEQFVLEYREGDAQHHFRAAATLSKAEVEQAFLGYRSGDERWRTEVPWEPYRGRPWWKLG